MADLKRSSRSSSLSLILLTRIYCVLLAGAVKSSVLCCASKQISIRACGHVWPKSKKARTAGHEASERLHVARELCYDVEIEVFIL